MIMSFEIWMASENVSTDSKGSAFQVLEGDRMQSIMSSVSMILRGL